MRLRSTSTIAIAVATMVAAAGIPMASAAVRTDQEDYSPGSVVTISGDNTDGAAYQPGETVLVAVAGPNGYQQSCSGVVGSGPDARWACEVNLWASMDAVGDYTYTAKGETSGVEEAGTFTDAQPHVDSFLSDCSTASDSFVTGATVCAKTAGLGQDKTGTIEWWAPGAASWTRKTSFSQASGNATDSFTPTICGTWTLKTYVPADTFWNAETFAVTGCSTANNAPTVGAGGPYSGNEGSVIALSGTASDSDGTIASATWTIPVQPLSGDCTLANASSLTTATITCTDNGVATVRLTAADDDAAVTSANATVTVSNVAPTATFSSPAAAVNEGSDVALALTSPYDPSSVDTAAGFSYAFDCGDGAGYGDFGSTASATCPTTDNGTRSVKGKIKDKDGGVSEYTSSVTVQNVAPSVAASISGNIDCRTNATLTWSFTDPGVNDSPWAVVVNWGDGTTNSEFTVSAQNAQTSRTHMYATPGTYSVVVTVTDKDGGVGTDDTGNSITVAQAYEVDFLPPFDDSSPSKLIVNKMKNGRVVPVKATLQDKCALQFVTDPSTIVTIRTPQTTGSGGTSDPVEEYADAGQSSGNTDRFRFSDGHWIYNLDSKAIGLTVNNFYRVDAYVGSIKATKDVWAVLQPIK